MEGYRVDKLDTGDRKRILEIVNNGWLQTYGKNTTMVTDDFLSDVFHPLFYEDRASIGIYDSGGELQATLCSFKVPVYYRRLGRTVNSVFGSFYVIDERHQKAGLSWELLKPLLELADYGYEQYIILAIPKAITNFVVKSKHLDVFREIVNFDYSPSASFNVRILVNNVFNDIPSHMVDGSDMEIGPVEEGRFSEYMDLLSRKKHEVDAFSDYPEEVWQYMLFGMREKRAWHCYAGGRLIALLVVNIHRTISSDEENGYIEIITLDALDKEAFFSLSYRFVILLRETMGLNDILIQNPTFYSDACLSQLKRLGFAQTMTKHTFHVFSLPGDHVNTMIESSSWLYPVF